VRMCDPAVAKRHFRVLKADIYGGKCECVHTHTHTHTYIYMFMCVYTYVCACVCVYHDCRNNISELLEPNTTVVRCCVLLSI